MKNLFGSDVKIVDVRSLVGGGSGGFSTNQPTSKFQQEQHDIRVEKFLQVMKESDKNKCNPSGIVRLGPNMKIRSTGNTNTPSVSILPISANSNNGRNKVNSPDTQNNTFGKESSLEGKIQNPLKVQTNFKTSITKTVSQNSNQISVKQSVGVVNQKPKAQTFIKYSKIGDTMILSQKLTGPKVNRLNMPILPKPADCVESLNSVSNNLSKTFNNVNHLKPLTEVQTVINKQLVPSDAGPVSALLQLQSRKISDYIRFCIQDILGELSEKGNEEATIKTLQLELERLQWKHQQELAELKRNSDLVLAEMRKSLQKECSVVIKETIRQCEAEKKRAVEETKKKQWCTYCGNEALFYCCWNTSYCDYSCQQYHWPSHMPMCAQTPQIVDSSNGEKAPSVLLQPPPAVLKPQRPIAVPGPSVSSPYVKVPESLSSSPYVKAPESLPKPVNIPFSMVSRITPLQVLQNCSKEFSNPVLRKVQ